MRVGTPLAMAGFVKRLPMDQPSRPYTVSTGIPTLDRIAHLVPGSISCVFEDEDSLIHNTILQIFVSSSLSTDRRTHVLAKEVKNLVSFKKAKADLETEEPLKNLQIAWRYQSVAAKEPQFEFDLMEREELGDEVRVDSIETLLDLMRTTRNANFAVFSLFSPLLRSRSLFPSSHALCRAAAEQSPAHKEYSTTASILFEMRQYCRLNHHCVLLSIPKFFVEEEISHYLDNIFEIRSMLTLPHEKSNYHCLVEFQKLTNIGSLRVNELESYRYGLVLRSKKLAIEQIDIPPEDTEPGTSLCGQSF